MMFGFIIDSRFIKELRIISLNFPAIIIMVGALLIILASLINLENFTLNAIIGWIFLLIMNIVMMIISLIFF